jgi:serine/threonine protein phosphatase PrpC
VLPRELEWYSEDTSHDLTAKSLHLVGFAETIGRRPRMEDMVVIKRSFRAKQEEDFFAVYDGHGGRKAVRYVSRNLHLLFARNLDKSEDPVKALRKVSSI